MRLKTIITFLFLFSFWRLFAQETIELSNQNLQISWAKSDEGWKISEVLAKNNSEWESFSTPSGEYNLLYSRTKPDSEPQEEFLTTSGNPFPGAIYKYIIAKWEERTSPVNLNTAGELLRFFPENAEKLNENQIRFTATTEWGELISTWKLLDGFSNDIEIIQRFKPSISGYFSVASPTLLTIPENQLKWATVPGYFHGNKLESNLPLSYGYGNGVPNRPLVFSETTASTLSPMVTSSNGFTIAAIPDPGLGRDPWIKDKITHSDWNIGLSHMNRTGQLSPTIYYPILGRETSHLEPGVQISYALQLSITNTDWFEMLNHAVYDVYQFDAGLAQRKNKESLSSRVESMHDYLMDPVTSLWRVEDFEGKKIGAQSYLGGVVGSQGDAMKNADYGAMWMLAKTTGNGDILKNILPYALNFKLQQQQISDGFFKGAAIGQYYLHKSKRFVEEWGDMVEPIALTYYIMLDIGNVLLFESENEILKERLRLGADLLLNWQKEDGSWAVAYERDGTEIFKEIKDFRPTFYGLLVAYKILGDKKYLDGAMKGADWFITNGVNNGSFLGVCGDARYVPDFATGQSAQAFLDLFEVVQEEKYFQAAVDAAKIYTTHIYTHPIASWDKKIVGSNSLADWEISQAGLSFEHGGALGSANGNGPILLASHAGMFIRMYELTGERIFRDMARSAGIGRDAFVNKETHVASYYWRAMDAGSGPFPHHAWWQIGWITDYLMAEVELRSGKRIIFPRGFIAPKVGPHQTYGFAPGKVFGVNSKLRIFPKGLAVSNPSIEHVVAESEDGKTLQIILLNQYHKKQEGEVELNLEKVGISSDLVSAKLLDASGKPIKTFQSPEKWRVELDEFGLVVLEITLK